MSWVKEIDERAARVALSFVKNLDTISLPRFRVVGDYVRYNDVVRNQLKDLKQMITNSVKAENNGQENFLLWGPQGSGKSEFARQLAKSFGAFVCYKELNLADQKEKDFREALAKLKDEDKPILCLIDEIDSRLAERWSCEAMLPYLELRTHRKFGTCFILAGSGGSDIAEMKSTIGLRQKGKDLLSRIPYRNEFTIPLLGIEDRIVVALSNLMAVARKSCLKLHEVDKLALLYVALNPHLSEARKIGQLMAQVVKSNRIPKGEDRFEYDKLFESGNTEGMEFWQRWQNENLLRVFVAVLDDQDQKQDNRNYGRARNRDKEKIEHHPKSVQSVARGRIEYDRHLRDRLRSAFKKEENIPEPWAQMLKDPDNLTAPAFVIPEDSPFVDCICTVLTKEGRILAILPSGESYPDKEGIGRTFTLLELLGLSVDTGNLLGRELEEIRVLENISIFFKPSSPYRLLAADMAYIGCTGGRLCMIPTKGERMSFIWDLARHVFRSTTLEYRTGDHRRQPGRQKLLEIFEKIDFKKIPDIYGQLNEIYTIDEVVLLRRRIAGEPATSLRELKKDEFHNQLSKAMMVSAEHGSEFWSRDKDQLAIRVKSVLDSLDPNRMPTVSEVSYSNPDLDIPDYIFEDIAKRVRTRENPPEEPTSKIIRTISGILLHNYQLSRGFQDVGEVRLLATSGEKIFRYKSFWKALSEARRPIVLKILLLDPKSSFLKEREQEAYSDKPEGFLKKEILDNIATLKRMSDRIAKANRNVHIICRVYDEQPSFRITLIGRERLLFTSYERGKRTGGETVFYEIDRRDFGPIYKGFEQYYQRFELNSKVVVTSNNSTHSDI